MSRTEAPFDTRWAIAAKVAAPKLQELADEAIIRAVRWRILEGADGFAAIVAGDGPAEDYDTFCAAFAAKTKSAVFLLDFHDEGESIREFSAKAKPKWIKSHPAAFLREHGIVAPGHEPRKRSPIRTVLVVEGATPAATKKASPDKTLAFEPHPRGTLVWGDVKVSSGTLAKKIGGRVYGLSCDTDDGRYWCNIDAPGGTPQIFEPGSTNQSQFREQVDNVLGEASLDGILRVLAIPKKYLEP